MPQFGELSSISHYIVWLCLEELYQSLYSVIVLSLNWGNSTEFLLHNWIFFLIVTKGLGMSVTQSAGKSYQTYFCDSLFRYENFLCNISFDSVWLFHISLYRIGRLLSWQRILCYYSLSLCYNFRKKHVLKYISEKSEKQLLFVIFFKNLIFCIMYV